MSEKRYVVTKPVRINDGYTIQKEKHLLIDWDGYDGATWKCEEDGTIGQPFVETNSIEEVPNKTLHLKRVTYGKDSVPEEMREYTVEEFPTSAVGTVKEIENFCREKGMEVELQVVK